MPELSLVLPVLNEEDIIEKVVLDIVRALDAAKIDYEILMVENGSDDRSLDVLKALEKKDPRLKALVAPKRGWGIAILTGHKSAKGTFVSHMPSDGQIDPGVLPPLLEKIRAKAADIVKIKRVTRENVLRTVNSWCFNKFATLLFWLGVKDANGCPKMYPYRLLEAVKLRSEDSFIELELLVKARRLGLSIYELGTPGLERAGGKSNTNIWTVLEFIRNMIRFRVQLWLGLA